MDLPIDSHVCHMYRFQRPCLCMCTNCFFIHLVVFASISLFFSDISRRISYFLPFSIATSTHIRSLLTFATAAQLSLRLSCATGICSFYTVLQCPPPVFGYYAEHWAILHKSVCKQKRPRFRVHPETRAWHSFLSDVRKSMITPRRAGRRLFSVFGIRDRESLGIWVDFEFACDFACSGCV